MFLISLCDTGFALVNSSFHVVICRRHGLVFCCVFAVDVSHSYFCDCLPCIVVMQLYRRGIRRHIVNIIC